MRREEGYEGGSTTISCTYIIRRRVEKGINQMLLILFLESMSMTVAERISLQYAESNLYATYPSSRP